MKRSFFSRRHLRNATVIIRLLIALLFALPLVWMLAASIHPPGVAMPNSLSLIPPAPSIDNFIRIFGIVPLGQSTLNSILVAAVAVPLTLLTASWAALGMARLATKNQRRWVFLSLAVLMVPGVALWSPRFLLYRALGWYDSIWALIAPAWMGTSPFFVLMFYRAFRRIPAAIYDAARLDGAGVLQLWAWVALPMARPTTVGVALLSFVFYWGDFISPLLYLSSENRLTLPVALQLLEQLARTDWGLLMAAAVWATFVPVTFFLVFQIYLARHEVG